MILVKILSGAFWLAVTGLTAYLAIDVIRTESDPKCLLGWLIMCAFFFVSASLLSYLMISAGRKEQNI